MLLETLHLAEGICGAEYLAGHLDLDLQRIRIVHAVNDEQIVRRCARCLDKHRLDLRREYINAAHHDHIIGSAGDPAHADGRSAAGTFVVVQRADVVRSVAQHGHTLLGDGGEHQLAGCAVGKLLAGHGVDDLRNDVILVDVGAVLALALKRNARTCDLGQTVYVTRVDAEGLLDVFAHLLRPRLCAEDAGTELDVLAGNEPRIADGLAEIRRIGRCAAEDGRAHLLHHHELTLGVAGGHGNDHRAEVGRALMRTETAGEQTVAVADLNDVVLIRAGSGEGTGDHLRPDVHIAFGIAGNDGLSGRAGRAVDADDLRSRHGKEPVGEGIAQVGLFHERELFNILDGLDIVGGHALGVHALTVVGYVVVLVLYGLVQALALEDTALLGVHALHFRVIDSRCHRSSPL